MNPDTVKNDGEPPKAQHRLANWALYAALSSWLLLPALGALVGLVLGGIALVRVESGHSPEAGRGKAQLAIALSVLNLLALAGVIFLLVFGLHLFAETVNKIQ